VWAVFVSPQEPVQLPGILVSLLQMLVFGAAAAGLVRTGNLALALAFMAVAVINALLMFAWGQ
jgi:Protein of unknown function (DUF2568)